MRCVALAGAFVAAMALVGVAPIASGAATPPNQGACSGTTCVELSVGADGTATPGSTVSFSAYLIFPTGTVDTASLTSDVGADLVVDVASLRIDGAAPPVPSVQHGNDMSATIAPPSIAAHNSPEITFTATVVPGALPYLEPKFSLTFTHGTSPAATAHTYAVVQRPAPDFRPRYTDPPVQVGRGDESRASVTIFNDNPQQVPALVTLTFPAGFSFVPGSATNDVAGSPSNPQIPCTTAGQVTRCTFLPEDQIGGMEFLFSAAADLPIGARASIGFTIEPVGQPDLHPADNTITIPVVVLGNARLVATLAAPTRGVTAAGGVKHLVLVVGQRTPIVVTVRNIGPDPAPATSLVYRAEGGPPPGLTLTPAAGHPFSNTSESIGTLAVGQTFTRVLYATAHRASVDALFVNFSADVNVIGPICSTTGCDVPAGLRVTAVGAAPTGSVPLTSTSVAPTAPSRGPVATSEEPLAATGNASGSQVAAGGLAIVIGLAFCLVGRRRSRQH